MSAIDIHPYSLGIGVDGAVTYSYSYYLAGCSISHIYMGVPQYLSHNILLPVYQLHFESALQPVLRLTVGLQLAYSWPTVGLPCVYVCALTGASRLPCVCSTDLLDGIAYRHGF